MTYIKGPVTEGFGGRPGHPLLMAFLGYLFPKVVTWRWRDGESQDELVDPQGEGFFTDDPGNFRVRDREC